MNQKIESVSIFFPIILEPITKNDHPASRVREEAQSHECSKGFFFPQSKDWSESRPGKKGPPPAKKKGVKVMTDVEKNIAIITLI